jgi:tape measure domain-containing protein
MAARTIAIRLTAENADAVKRALEGIGKDGKAALNRVNRASEGLGAGVTGAAAASDVAVRAFGSLSTGLGGLNASVGALVSGLSGATLGLGALGAAAGTALVGIARAGDEMTGALGRLSTATGSLQAATGVYDQLYRLSLQTGVAVNESVGSFARFAIAAREVGATNDQALALVGTLQRAAIVAGASGGEVASAATQLAQALASGVLQGDELRSLLENMPNLAQGLARELGVSVGELRKMGAEGTLTADRVLPALIRAGQQVNAEFEKMPPTMGRAFDVLGVAMTRFAADLDKALGLSQAIARAVQAAANAVDRTRSAFMPSATEAADADIAGSRDRIANLRRQIEGYEPGLSDPGRRGGLRPGLQGTAASQVGADRLAELRAQLAAEEALLAEHELRRAQIAAEGNITRFGEQQAAAEQARQATQRRDAQTLRELRENLDSTEKARREHAERLTNIDGLLARGSIDQAEATRLRARSVQELNEAIEKAGSSARQAAEAARREVEATAKELERWEGLVARIVQPTVEANRRARDAANRAEQDALRERERANKQTTDEIVRYGAETFADLFDTNRRGWEGMLDSFYATFRRIFARMAAEAIIRPIVSPVVEGWNSAGGSGAGQNGAGGGSSYFDYARQAYSAYDRLSGVNPSRMMGPGYTWNTGYSGIDSLANTTVWGGTPVYGSAVVQPGSVGLGSEAAAYVGNDFGAAGATGGMSAGSAAMGALGIAGGLYGAYSGIQRGGVGGYTQAAGGAATAGLSAAAMAGMSVPVYGWIAAAALMVIGALLPGQKPSDRTGYATMNTVTDEVTVTGLEGKRFSQENRDAARQIAQSVDSVAENIGRLAGISGPVDSTFTVGMGSRDGARVTIGGESRSFGSDEDAAQQLVAFATQKLLEEAARQTSDSNVSAIIRRAGGDTAGALGDLDWYQNTYVALNRTTEEVEKLAAEQNSYTRAIAAAAAPLDDAIWKTRQLGLEEARLVERRQEAVDAVTKARDAEYAGFLGSLDRRVMRVTGRTDEAEWAERVATNDNEWRTTAAQLKDMGLEADRVTAAMNKLYEVHVAEGEELRRQQIERREGAARSSALNVVTDLGAYVRGLATTEGSGTLLDRYGAARQQFDAVYSAALGGDATSISGFRDAAETLRTLGREVYGGGQGYADTLSLILDRAGAITGMGNDALTQAFVAENDRRNTDRMVDATSRVEVAIEALRRDLNLAMSRPSSGLRAA